LVIAAAAILVLGLSGTAVAFHEGGVAHCDGCHTMHGSQDGVAFKQHGHGDAVVGDAGESTLLAGSDASSTCLNCHAGNGGYHIASTVATEINESGGGDFFWLQQDPQVDFGWRVATLSGDNFGHNIIAGDFGYTADATLAAAPGGSFSASLLGCTSCHDAHGQVNGGTGNGTAAISGSGSYGDAAPTDGSILGNYRLLGDSAYTAGGIIVETSYTFSNDAPVAMADNGGWGATHYGQRVDYGSGMSEWCANCHSGFYTLSSSEHRHPAADSAHLNGEAGNYNAYRATGDYDAARTASYDGLVPIERGITNSALLDVTATGSWDTFGTIAADSSSNVMCLTCHRAHANGNENIGRWDFSTELLDHSYRHSLLGGDTITDLDANHYYDATSIDIASRYGPYQRSLCNKCHVQD
jgi:hypothetical protein